MEKPLRLLRRRSAGRMDQSRQPGSRGVQRLVRHAAGHRLARSGTTHRYPCGRLAMAGIRNAFAQGRAVFCRQRPRSAGRAGPVVSRSPQRRTDLRSDAGRTARAERGHRPAVGAAAGDRGRPEGPPLRRASAISRPDVCAYELDHDRSGPGLWAGGREPRRGHFGHWRAQPGDRRLCRASRRRLCHVLSGRDAATTSSRTAR